MHQLRLALLAVGAFIGTALPASAQMLGGNSANPGNPGNFVYIWVVILVVGIIVFVAGTSIVGQPKK